MNPHAELIAELRAHATELDKAGFPRTANHQRRAADALSAQGDSSVGWLRELSEKATPGPWQVERPTNCEPLGWIGSLAKVEHDIIADAPHEDGDGEKWHENAAFIVASVNYVRTLLSTVSGSEGGR